MIAIEISSFGPPEVLRPADVAKPVAGPGDVVISVKAAGVARADTLQRQGKYPPPPGASEIPGLDVAGQIDSVGPGVTSWKPGDSVCAILSGGGYAEFCAVPAVQVLPLPQGWTFAEAVTLPENLFTVYDNLVTRAGLTSGETALIHGGASGIGSMALMVSRFLRAEAFATAGSDAKCDACLTFGANHAINYRTSDFVQEVKRKTGGRGVDVILDLVGGDYLGKNLDVLATEGRIAVIATQGGRTAQLDLGALMRKRCRVIGSTMRARSSEEKGRVAERLLKRIWPALPTKDPIRPVIDSQFPLTDAAKAHARMESGEHIGKIVLVP
ncbi:MAG: NAD(P)H-quinone oxidoreductase [Acidobacteriaceae bacterium]|nr:NAD(P)H-quinone oxidoreductase [Acidobacteriaceae bacterium]